LRFFSVKPNFEYFKRFDFSSNDRYGTRTLLYYFWVVVHEISLSTCPFNISFGAHLCVCHVYNILHLYSIRSRIIGSEWHGHFIISHCVGPKGASYVVNTRFSGSPVPVDEYTIDSAQCRWGPKCGGGLRR